MTDKSDTTGPTVEEQIELANCMAFSDDENREIFSAILASLRHYQSIIRSAEMPVEPAKSQYNKFMSGIEEKDPVERLRFFCSLAMRGQDWLDVEPFLNDVSSALQRAEKAESELAALRDIARNFSEFVHAKECSTDGAVDFRHGEISAYAFKFREAMSAVALKEGE